VSNAQLAVLSQQQPAAYRARRWHPILAVSALVLSAVGAYAIVHQNSPQPSLPPLTVAKIPAQTPAARPLDRWIPPPETQPVEGEPAPQPSWAPEPGPTEQRAEPQTAAGLPVGASAPLSSAPSASNPYDRFFDHRRTLADSGGQDRLQRRPLGMQQRPYGGWQRRQYQPAWVFNGRSWVRNEANLPRQPMRAGPWRQAPARMYPSRPAPGVRSAGMAVRASSGGGARR
jgi:hypothetical protein